MLSEECANGDLSSVGLALAGLLVLSGLPGWAWGQNEPAKVQVKGESSPPSAAATAPVPIASYYVAVDGRPENSARTITRSTPWTLRPAPHVGGSLRAAK